MSELSKLTGAGLELATDQQPNPAIPRWLGEVVLLGEYWRTTGLLDRLQTQVRVNRGRMGQYEVCDFVLLLLAYAVSGLATLREFFEQLSSVQAVLMSVWQRQQCPGASTLSRFLGDIEGTALEQLRTLFEADLSEHGFDQSHSGGMMDRTGHHFWVFDVDGTHQVARQRTLVSDPSYPKVRRRSQGANAKGYLGRRRGEVTRTRSTVAQAHTSEWLGTFGAPGNGTPGADLEDACRIIGQYLQQHQMPGSRAIVRLDGYYGLPQFVNQIQQHQLGYILRSRDYGLLQHPALQTRLQTTPVQLWSHPEAHQEREVFDLGFVDDSWAGYSQPVRLIVVRTPYNPKRKHRIGKRLGSFIYELFITSHLQESLTGGDILSLYYGRGGFEKVLGDEDVEQDCDRWCSWHPEGQEFWQILSQWVWNWRLWAGFAHQPQPLRQTIWVAAEAQHPTPPINPAPSPEVLVLSERNAPCPPVDSTTHGPMQVAGGWARGRGKFFGPDFTLLNERTLQCPAGHSMYRREVRQNRQGDLLILFGINPRTCQQCLLKSQCLADGSKGTGGRRITVVRKKLTSPQTQPQPISIPQPLPVTHSNPQQLLPVIWLDFPTTRLRRDLTHQLQKNQIVIEPIIRNIPMPQVKTAFITRDQRAHRRLTWAQRWDRNAITNAVAQWQVKLFGISSAVLDWLSSLKPRPVVII
jgi:nitroreductase